MALRARSKRGCHPGNEAQQGGGCRGCPQRDDDDRVVCKEPARREAGGGQQEGDADSADARTRRLAGRGHRKVEGERGEHAQATKDSKGKFEGFGHGLDAAWLGC